MKRQYWRALLALVSLILSHLSVLEARVPDAGVYSIWATTAESNAPYVKGYQLVYNWGGFPSTFNASTGKGQYDFSAIGQAILDNNPQMDPSNARKGSLQINGNTHPSWMFTYDGGPNKGTVPYCTNLNGWDSQVKDTLGVPMYWHPSYLAEYENLLEQLDSYLSSNGLYPFILGVRLNFNAVGTEKTAVPHAYNPSNPNTPWVIPSIIDSSTVVPNTTALKDAYLLDVAEAYYETLAHANGVQVYCRNNADSAIVDYLATAEANGAKVAWFHTSSELEPVARWQERDQYQVFWDDCRSGDRAAYAETYASAWGDHGASKHEYRYEWASPPQFGYWTNLLNLHCGVSYIAIYGKELNVAINGEYHYLVDFPSSSSLDQALHALDIYKDEFTASLEFTDRYAGYHADPTGSPGAWVAFRENLVANAENTTAKTDPTLLFINDPFKLDYTFLVDSVVVPDRSSKKNELESTANGTPQGSTVLEERDYSIDKTVGPRFRRYGAFALRMEDGDVFEVDFDDAFLGSLQAGSKIRLVALNDGSQTGQILIGTQNSTTTLSVAPNIVTIDGTDFNDWSEYEVAIDSAMLADLQNGLPVEIDSVGSGQTDLWLHMLELKRGAAGNVPVTGVSVSPSTLDLKNGRTGQLSVSVSPSDATDATVSWTSSDASVATVDANGLVTATGPGSASITATSDDGGYAASSSVTVTRDWQVWVCIGQSLMRGQNGDYEDLTDASLDGGIVEYAWDYGGSLQYPTISDLPSYLGMGPGEFFARTLKERGEEDVCIVKIALGGHPISAFLKPSSLASGVQKESGKTDLWSTDQSSEWLDRVQEKLALLASGGDSASLRGVVMFQGFNDLIDPYGADKRANYNLHLKRLVADSRAYLGEPELPWLQVVSPNWTQAYLQSHVGPLQQAQRDAALSTAYMSSVESDPSLGSPVTYIAVDNAHPDFPSAERIGVAIANAWESGFTAQQDVSEDFSSAASESSFTVEIGSGDWNVTGGEYRLANPSNASNGYLGNVSVYDAAVGGDYTVGATFDVVPNNAWDDGELVFGFQDANNYYYVSANEQNDATTHGLFKIEGGAFTQLAEFGPGTEIAAGTPFQIRVERSDAESSISVYLDEVLVASAVDGSFVGGRVGFGTKNDQVAIDDFFVSYAGAPTVPATGVSVSPGSLSLLPGGSAGLSATVSPVDATDQGVSWSTSDATVATVDASGQVTAVGAGAATITVTTDDGGFVDTCAVTVTIPVTGVSVSPATLDLLLSETYDLTETVAPANATDQGVSWSTSDASVATVDASGLVTAVGAGAATITVTTDDGGFVDTCAVSVTVLIPVTGVSVTPATLDLAVNATANLTETVSPANATDQGVTWSTSDASVATVSSSGLVTAVGAGSATITVTTDDGGFTDASSIVVTVPVTGVSVTPATLDLAVNATADLTETVSPANATDQGVTWSTSDASVATVDSNGLVTAVSDGVATITVTTNDGSYTDTCEVIVTGVFVDPIVWEDFSIDAASFTPIYPGNPPDGGTWSVSNGRYALDNFADHMPTAVLSNVSLHTGVFVDDYTVRGLLNVLPLSPTDTNWDDVALVFGYQGEDDYYYVSLNESNGSGTNGLFKVVNGSGSQIADFSPSLLINSQTDYVVEVKRDSDAIDVYVDGSLMLSSTGQTDHVGGRVGFASRNNDARFDDLLAYPDNVVYEDFLFSSAISDFASGNGAGTWTVTGGQLELSGSSHNASNGYLGAIRLHADSVSGDYSVEADLNVVANNAWDDGAIVFGYQDTSNYYYLDANEQNDATTHGLFMVANGSFTQLAEFAAGTEIAAGVPFHLKIVVVGSTIEAYIDGSLVGSASSGSVSTDGQFGFGTKNDQVDFDNLVVIETPGS